MKYIRLYQQSTHAILKLRQLSAWQTTKTENCSLHHANSHSFCHWHALTHPSLWHTALMGDAMEAHAIGQFWYLYLLADIWRESFWWWPSEMLLRPFAKNISETDFLWRTFAPRRRSRHKKNTYFPMLSYARNLYWGRDKQAVCTTNAKMSCQYKYPEYGENSHSKAYHFFSLCSLYFGLDILHMFGEHSPGVQRSTAQTPLMRHFVTR